MGRLGEVPARYGASEVVTVSDARQQQRGCCFAADPGFTDAADLRPMLGRQARQMHLDDLHHAAGITVDEEGGVAVAAAAATVRAKSLALALPRRAVDRAFATALVHQASGAPVFVGRVGGPLHCE